MFIIIAFSLKGEKMETRSMTFNDYVSRRLQPVKLLVSLLSKELEFSKDDEIIFSRDELENVIATLEIYIEEYALALEQARGSRRTKAADAGTAYPTEKKPDLKSVA